MTTLTSTTQQMHRALLGHFFDRNQQQRCANTVPYAIDSNDGLHVSDQYNSGNALKYAYKASGLLYLRQEQQWMVRVANSPPSLSTRNDKPHIAYRDSGGDVGYAEKTNGSSWTSGTVQTAGDIASTSIAIDSDDHIHIAYYDSSNDDMYHLTDTSGSWVRTFVEDIGWNAAGMSTDIAIDPTTDQPGISYLDAGANRVGLHILHRKYVVFCRC